MNKLKVQGYISKENDVALKKYLAAYPKKTKSSVIDAALGDYFSNTTDTDVLYRRLDRQQRSIGKVTRDLEVLQEAFAVFVRLWFAHTPRVGEGEREAAQHYASMRYEQFCEFVGDQLAQGHKFVDDLAEDLPGMTAADPMCDKTAVGAAGKDSAVEPRGLQQRK